MQQQQKQQDLKLDSNDSPQVNVSGGGSTADNCSLKIDNSPILSQSSGTPPSVQIMPKSPVVFTPEQYKPSCIAYTSTVSNTGGINTNEPGIAVSSDGHDQVKPMSPSPEQHTPSYMADVITPNTCSSGTDTPCFGGKKAKDPMYVPDTPGLRSLRECCGSNSPFLTSAAQLEKLISSINATSCCRAEGCNGELRLKSVSLQDMGGDGTAYFTCSGRCGSRDIHVTLPCSGPYTYKGKDTKQTVISVSLQIAFLCSGANYAQYENVLGSLGMYPASQREFYDTIRMLYDPVKEMLDAQCELGKKK